MKEENYLANMPSDIINQYGLSKTLMTRRETIYLKHILKNLFICGDEKTLNEKLEILKFSSLFQYITYISNKLRGIYKISRSYKVDNVNDIVKQRRSSIIRTLQLYKNLNPIVIIDFDNTITNKKFHNLYEYLCDEGFTIIINSANPNKEAIQNYLNKYRLNSPKEIFANKGRQKKILKLKDIAMKNINRILFYIDDEENYLELGCLLGIHCYKYTKNGKAKSYTFFKK